MVEPYISGKLPEVQIIRDRSSSKERQPYHMRQLQGNNTQNGLDKGDQLLPYSCIEKDH